MKLTRLALTILGVSAPLWTATTSQAAQEKPAPAVDPDKWLKEIKVPKGWSASLFALPPDVNYPVQLSCALNGDVFVALDPNGSLGKDPKHAGKIVRLSDPKGTGKFEKITQFVPSIEAVRGMVADDNKLYVLNPPFVHVYTDENGDGVADKDDKLIDGIGIDWKFRGADHTTNGIRMGIDGWIYIAVGDFGFTEAVCKDGSKLQHHGGCVARFRPDGTELEKYAIGTRNICDIAIDPFMNVYTRDNTNDGDGWNVRLSHIIQSSNYGYPSLFKRFNDEIQQPIKDVGGGGPTGALYVDEPGLPAPYGNQCYTVDWGRSIVFNHSYEPSGSSFKYAQDTFVQIPKPTDMDVDGRGYLYIASWRDGGFSYSHANVGYVARVTPENFKPNEVPDIKKATDEALAGYLNSPSHVLRMAVEQEILRRGEKPALVSGVEKVAKSGSLLQSRVAAVYTLKQLQGAKSHEFLLGLLSDAKIKEHALRALTDRKKQLAGLSAKPFIDALKDSDARVRLQAAICLGRLGKIEAAEELLEATKDADMPVRHVAVKALIELNAVDAALAALDKNPDLAWGATQVLQAIHGPKSSDGLAARVEKTSNEDAKKLIIRALCRLYTDEAPWDGKWWTTRPDTTGPYYKTVKWAQSDKILDTLTKILNESKGEMMKYVVTELFKHKVDLASLAPKLMEMAKADPASLGTSAELLSGATNAPAEAIPLMIDACLSDKVTPEQARSIFTNMSKNQGKQEYLDALVSICGGWVKDNDKIPQELKYLRGDFTRDTRNQGRIPFWSKLAEGSDANKRVVAFAAMLEVTNNQQVKKENADAAQKAIDAAWAKAETSVSLLNALAITGVDKNNAKVKEKLNDTNADVKNAAILAAKKLKIDTGGKTVSAEPRVLISSLPFEKVQERASVEHGDVEEGQQLFVKSGCLNCHVVNEGDPPKGPFLKDIYARYKRPEIIESIVKPNAKIVQGFETFLFKMKGGKVVTGFIVKESADEVEIRQAGGEPSTLKVADIEKRVHGTQSMMPDGLVANLTVKELCSILDYLESINPKK